MKDIRPQAESESGAGMASIINHLPAILWQRRLYVIATFLVLTLAGVIAAFSLPTLYRSNASLLVQTQQISTDVVQSPGSGAIEQRISRIRERVLSRGDLIGLIEQYGLYPSERQSRPMSYVVEKMRKATTVGALAGDIGQSHEKDLVAVTMSFDYREPALAQSVLQSYVNRFLQMDNESVEDQANLTVRFLQDQSTTLQEQISKIEGELTELKARSGAALASAGAMPFMDTGSYSAQIAGLENQNRQLLAQSRSAPQVSPEIAQAEAALAAARATYSDNHPDVAQAQARLEAVRRLSRSNPANDQATIQEQIRANNAAIASLSAARNSALARASTATAGQARAPVILEQAMQLESRASGLREQFRKISDDLLKAQNSARLANEQRGERLSLVEPPQLPDRPHWPNRPLLIGAAAAAGLILGLFLALAGEILTRPVRSPKQINSMGFPVLGVVPVIDRGPQTKWWRPFQRREKQLA